MNEILVAVGIIGGIIFITLLVFAVLGMFALNYKDQRDFYE